MNSARWTVFVEGESDEAFARSLLGHLSLSFIEIEPIRGGVDHIPHVAPQIRRRADSGRLIAVVLDANMNPEGRRQKVEQVVVSLRLPVSQVFLLPNDKEPGCLETLLESLAVRRHRVIYDCFSQYEECVSGHSDEYELPDSKARVYAYCAALGTETQPKKRDYCDSRYWDLAAPSLQPLKAFFLSLHSE